MAKTTGPLASSEGPSGTPSGGPVAPLPKLMGWIGKAVCLLGSAIALGGCGWSRLGAPGPARVEFPLGVVRDVATDSRGRIYVAVGMYSRVQRYSPDGQFEVGWSVPTAGFFALRTTPDDRVQVAAARANKLLTYSPDGELLDSQVSLKDDLSPEFASERETTGGYIVQRGLFPRVVDPRTGQTVITSPWPKRLLATPFPVFGYVILGLSLFVLSEALRRWRRASTA